MKCSHASAEQHIFKDRRGRRWVCGYALKMFFGISEPINRHFWNYDVLCKRFRKIGGYRRE